MAFVLWSILYLPIIFTIIGVISLILYLYHRLVKKQHTKKYLIISYVSMSLVLLSFILFFIVGTMGIGPIPN